MIRTEDDLRDAYERFASADTAHSIDQHTRLVDELSDARSDTRRRRAWLAPALSAAAVVAVIGGVAAAGVGPGRSHSAQPASSTSAAPVPRYLGPIKATKDYIHLDLILSPPGTRTPALSPARAVATWCTDLRRLLRRVPASIPVTCTSADAGATMVFGSGHGYFGVDYGNPSGLLYVLTWTQAPCDPKEPPGKDGALRRCTGEAAIDATTGAPLGEIMLTSQSRPDTGELVYSARFGTNWPPHPAYTRCGPGTTRHC
jgi:hypothetical protein